MSQSVNYSAVPSSLVQANVSRPSVSQHGRGQAIGTTQGFTPEESGDLSPKTLSTLNGSPMLSGNGNGMEKQTANLPPSPLQEFRPLTGQETSQGDNLSLGQENTVGSFFDDQLFGEVMQDYLEQIAHDKTIVSPPQPQPTQLQDDAPTSTLMHPQSSPVNPSSANVEAQQPLPSQKRRRDQLDQAVLDEDDVSLAARETGPMKRARVGLGPKPINPELLRSSLPTASTYVSPYKLLGQPTAAGLATCRTHRGASPQTIHDQLHATETKLASVVEMAKKERAARAQGSDALRKANQRATQLQESLERAQKELRAWQGKHREEQAVWRGSSASIEVRRAAPKTPRPYEPELASCSAAPTSRTAVVPSSVNVGNVGPPRQQGGSKFWSASARSQPSMLPAKPVQESVERPVERLSIVIPEPVQAAAPAAPPRRAAPRKPMNWIPKTKLDAHLKTPTGLGPQGPFQDLRWEETVSPAHASRPAASSPAEPDNVVDLTDDADIDLSEAVPAVVEATTGPGPVNVAADEEVAALEAASFADRDDSDDEEPGYTPEEDEEEPEDESAQVADEEGDALEAEILAHLFDGDEEPAI